MEGIGIRKYEQATDIIIWRMEFFNTMCCLPTPFNTANSVNCQYSNIHTKAIQKSKFPASGYLKNIRQSSQGKIIKKAVEAKATTEVIFSESLHFLFKAVQLPAE